jgi:hypothetical protein
MAKGKDKKKNFKANESEAPISSRADDSGSQIFSRKSNPECNRVR